VSFGGGSILDRMPDGMPVGGRDVPLGGQAVIEGVMVRGVGTWAVAVRTPEGAVEVTSEALVSWTRRHGALRLPVVRGIVALVESLRIGLRALAISARAQLEADQRDRADGIGGTSATSVLALAFGAALFFLLPLGVTGLLNVWVDLAAWLFVALETVVRVGILVGYIAMIGRLGDLRGMLAYHGAEHKTISCYEASDRLTPARAQLYSRLHPRCGTSFLLAVMVVAAFVFAPLGTVEWYWMALSRVLGIPVAVGLSYEAIKWMGRHRRWPWVQGLMWPGLMLQSLTTREPDRDQLAVAIAALESVLTVETPGEAPDAGQVEVVA
jgi:uncharacterized protein YqhQ